MALATLEPVSTPTSPPVDARRVLVITAHPDDVDFGAAGTVAGWVSSGYEVFYCVATDGDAGGFDRAVDRSEIPRIRRAEQRAAAGILGVDEVTFLGRRDGELVPDLDLRRAFAAEIRRTRPDIVVCQSPEIYYDRLPASHPDHRAAGEAALCAVYPDARNPFAFPDLLDAQLEPHLVTEVWLMGHPGADHAVDITDTFDQKLAAIAAHESQLPDPERVEQFVREWASSVAVANGLPEDRFAEVFKRIELG